MKNSETVGRLLESEGKRSDLTSQIKTQELVELASQMISFTDEDIGEEWPPAAHRQTWPFKNSLELLPLS